MVRLRYVFRWGIRAVPFASMCFWICSLIPILAGVISFVLFLLGTLGVGVFGIDFSIVALWIGLELVRCGCSITLGVIVGSLGFVSAGALVALSKVILCCIGPVAVVVGTCSGLLLRIASSFCSASISSSR